MQKLLIVVDMQRDFVTGALGTPEARAMVPAVVEKVKRFLEGGDDVVFTRDTHASIYLDTREGRYLPVPHCVRGTPGWEIIPELAPYAAQARVFDKPTFGSLELAQWITDRDYTQIELCGVCTDICVVSNALLIKAHLTEADLSVDAALCAGVTPESHAAALTTMRMCQIDVRGGTAKG